MTGQFDYNIIAAAVSAARRVLDAEYPDAEYLPLVLVLPIQRDLIRQARAGVPGVDAAIRESLNAVVNSVQWPER